MSYDPFPDYRPCHICTHYQHTGLHDDLADLGLCWEYANMNDDTSPPLTRADDTCDQWAPPAMISWPRFWNTETTRIVLDPEKH